MGEAGGLSEQPDQPVAPDVNRVAVDAPAFFVEWQLTGTPEDAKLVRIEAAGSG